MAKLLGNLKDELKELAGIVNSFKSEAVQLKIVESLLKGIEVDAPAKVGRKKPGRKPKVEVVAKVKEPGKRGGRKPGPKGGPRKRKVGPSKTLDILMDGDFFKTHRALGDVVAHCNENLKTDFKSTDLSGPLMKLVKENKLKREKNPTSNQFEYFLG
ncbi:MAG: hypothetical protein JW861_02175 [Bacteroidales bacterium]|nr:hypothetical protein [Bacteroidales bacterium]